MPKKTRRWLADRAAITDVLHRYAKGVDTMDPASTAACFTSDCRYEIGEDEVVEGRAALVDFFDDKTGIRKRETGLDAVQLFTHVMSNIVIEIEDARADVESVVTAYVVGTRDATRVMLVRCVRYDDEFAREDGDWLIARRRHVFQWMYEATPTAVRTA
jgi:3-phenylpropionate/cinnamic acid dioxygenase small subunit